MRRRLVRWLRRPWACWLGKHAWMPDHLRLVVLTDKPGLQYADGYPVGRKYDCIECGKVLIK